MKIIKPYYKIFTINGVEPGNIPRDDMLFQIEYAARICYKSTDKMGELPSEALIKHLRDNGHTSMLEFSNLTVEFVCDRAIANELERHRICSYAQQSTRYVDECKDGMEVICPPEIEADLDLRADWIEAMVEIEQMYQYLRSKKITKQSARSLLPLGLATTVIASTNFTAWRHIFQRRCATDAHPQLRELMVPLLEEVKTYVPIIFDDLEYTL